MPEMVTCLACGITAPPPEQTCDGGTPGSELRDHFVGTDHGCPNCGRLAAACARRPCSAMRATVYEAGWDDGGTGGSDDDA